MAGWLAQRSIRNRIWLLIVAMLLPVAATLVWFLAADVHQAQASARARVRSLATGTAKELQRRLGDTERVLARLAARPAVQAMGTGACEPMMAEYLLLTPGFSALSVHDLQGRSVCGAAAAQPPLVVAAGEVAGAAANAANGMRVGPVQVRVATGGRIMALRHPIRDTAGHWLGQLVLEVDLLALNQHLLPPMPDHAVVTVIDASGTVVLRSTDPGSFIGGQPLPDAVDPAGGAREGFFEAAGRDGVPRLFAFVTLPQTGWRVAGSLPLADVLAGYHGTRQRTVAIGLGLALLALVLGWRLSAAIVQPVAGLRDAAERVALGDTAVRSPVGGPPEVRAVALAFNRMLDARVLSESRLRGIFGSALDAIITCDDDQQIVEANPAAARMFRCSVDAMIGAPLDRFIPARLRQAHGQAVRQFGDTGAAARRMAAQREVLALRADGEEFLIEASISQLSVGGRRLYTVIHRDITDRRRAELALRDSEARLRRLLAHLPEAVLVSSADRIGFVNPAACQLLGADAAALLGSSLMAFIQADDRPRLQAHLARGDLAGGDPTSAGQLAPLAEVTIVRADGASRQVESLGTPVDYDGGHATLIVLRDISALKRAQADLEASHADLTRLVTELDNIQEAERKRIARELHDDLQQTLAAIRMDLGAISAGLDRDRSAAVPSLSRVERLAESAIASTRRIINDMRPQMLEDLGLVAALEALATRFAHRHGVACRLLASGLPPDEACIDAKTSTCLYRVAQEALNNVAKHAQARHVQLQLRLVGADRLQLTVRDDGLGFADADLRKPQSFGLLGMKERVRAAQGTLRVDGVAGSGTTLAVEVPLAAA